MRAIILPFSDIVFLGGWVYERNPATKKMMRRKGTLITCAMAEKRLDVKYVLMTRLPRRVNADVAEELIGRARRGEGIIVDPGAKRDDGPKAT